MKYYKGNSNTKLHSNSNTLRSNSKSQNFNSIHKVNIWYGNGVSMNNNNISNNVTDSNDDYSGISVDKPLTHTKTTNSIKMNEYKSFSLNKNSLLSKSANMNGVDKMHFELNQDSESQEESCDTSLSNSQKENKATYEWPKNNKLFSNETISFDVDEEKMVGILV